MSNRIMFYSSGSFARILRYIPQFISDFEFYSFCPNYNSYNTCRNSSEIKGQKYLYEDFNYLFNELDFNKTKEDLSFLNFARIHFTDKSSYKRYQGKYQEKIILCMSKIIHDYISEIKPSYIFFPIIESIDAMIAYEICKHLNIETICNAHGRLINQSFYSCNHTETLPFYYSTIKSDNKIKSKAKRLVNDYVENPKPLVYKNEKIGSRIFEDEKKEIFIKRFINSLKLKYGIEKHNRFLKLWVKFLVLTEKIVVPLQKLNYSLIEKFYLKSINNIPENSIFFPIHFSPESSINTPSPFYIDQLRVIDKILIEKTDNTLLLIKEHPAMFNKRGFQFYKKLRNTPFIRVLNKDISSTEILRKSKKVVSVTGTICMEAFFLGIDWEQYGVNFLSEWVKENSTIPKKDQPYKFTEDVLKVSSEFMLYSPSNNKTKNDFLFSYNNVKNMSELLIFHINQINKN